MSIPDEVAKRAVEEFKLTAPVPKPRPKPAYAMVKVGVRNFKARILWSDYDERHPDTFVVLGPKDQRMQVRRSQMVMLP